MSGGVYLGNIMPPQARICRVRWRFDFAGKVSRFGIWNNSGGSQEETHKTSAWCINKTGLVRAAIEAEYFDGWEIRTVLECDGPDFVNFEWRAATPAPMSTKGLLGESLTINGQTIGLTLVTADHRSTFFCDGKTQTNPRTEADKAIKLAAWRR